MELVDRLIASVDARGTVRDVRVGIHWTAVVIDAARGLRAGLAATLAPAGREHGQPAVREAGRLAGKSAGDVLALARSSRPTERSIGFAAINALIEVDEAHCVPVNAEEIIVAKGAARQVAVVGHFPFVERVRESARRCWVLELAPAEGDLPAERAPEIIPQADVIAITGMTLLNGTFEGLVGLARPDAFILVLGPSTPLSSLLFEYGVQAISSTAVIDIPAVLDAVSQGASFRQMGGRRLLTMLQAPEAGRR